MRQAKEYEEKMINRVNYLQKEEQRFLKKIVETREEAERQNKKKSDKITELQERIKVE